MAPAQHRRFRKADDDTSGPVLITAARKPYEEELADRKRRYIILMSIRIPALVLAAMSYALWHNGWIALAIIGGSIPIPWIAVLGANDRPKRSKKEPKGYAAGTLLTTTRPQLGPAGVVSSTPRPESAQTEGGADDFDRAGDGDAAHPNGAGPPGSSSPSPDTPEDT